jgi:hypothetical protein
MWAALERYKEFITNGFDLLSFLLVTPELVRLVRPAFARAFVIFSATSIGCLVAAIPSAIAASIIPFYRVSSAFTVFAPLIALFIGRWLRPRMNSILPMLDALFAKYAFLSGVILFFISRIVAFSVVGHQLLSPAEVVVHSPSPSAVPFRAFL